MEAIERESSRLHDSGILTMSRLQGLEEINAQWTGHERRSDAAFSDEQVKRIKELFDERAEVHAGRLAFRAFLSAVGLLAIGAASAVFAFFGIKR